jgi:hypothetical protein
VSPELRALIESRPDDKSKVPGPKSKVSFVPDLGPSLRADLRPWTSDPGLPCVPSRPAIGVGSPISWVSYLSRIRDPTQPLVFSPSRDCRGSFLPLVKKDPHHRRGSFFRSRRGSFSRQRRAGAQPAHLSARNAAVLGGISDLGPALGGSSTSDFGPTFGGSWTLDQNPLSPVSHKNSNRPRSVFSEFRIDVADR